MIQETEVMQIIVYAGNGKSLAMTAIKEAKTGNLKKAKEILEESKENLKIGHQHHTTLLQEFAGNPDEPVNMFMSHAQDHLMAGITAVDFAKEFIDLYEVITDLKEQLKNK